MGHSSVAVAVSAIAALAGCHPTRGFIFQPPPARQPELPDGGRLVQVPTPGGPPAVALCLPASTPRAPLVVHFHGNAEQLSDLTGLASRFHDEGLGFCAVEYPGYGIAAGSPSEASVVQAADSVLRSFSTAGAEVVLEGYSLGTGVATEMAHRGFGKRLVLLAPLSSVDAVARRTSSLAGPLIEDHFDNASKAKGIGIPVLIVHGTADSVIPYSMGRELAGSFPRARLLTVEGADHGGLFAAPGVFGSIVAFAAAPPG